MIIKKITSFEKTDSGVLLAGSGAIINVSFSRSDIIRLKFNTGKALRTEETFVVENAPVYTHYTCAKISGGITLKTKECTATIKFNPFSISLKDKKGNSVVESAPGSWAEADSAATKVRLSLTPCEKIYGLGQDPMANLDQRDKERRMWNEWGGARHSGNNGIPFYMSTNGYGLLLNSSWSSRFAIGKSEVAAPGIGPQMAPAPWPWESHSGESDPGRLALLLDSGIMDLFIICRRSVDSLHEAYIDLSGRPPMPPRWALGFIQCKNRYRTQEEFLSIGRNFRKRGIPCDVLVIDWQWFKQFGDLHWYTRYWPDPKAMCDEMMAMGIQVMQAQHPFVEKDSMMYQTFLEKGFLNKIPEGIRPSFDHSNPEAREAWWQETKRLYDDGIRSYWTDMGELEVHAQGTTHYLGSRERVHNIYSTLWTKALYEGQRRDYTTRVFSLPRAAYAGIQRYGAAFWSNDIDSTWEVFKDQVVIGQGVCLSGQQYWTTDIGGFFSHSPFDAELYLRWFEWGVFCPIFRTHGTRAFNEPWEYGPQTEKILTDYIKLRYRLLPYIYSLARKVTEKGTPIMRAMCVDFADDPVAVQQLHQFMFGPSILVAPIVEHKARSRKVYLPRGTWYDFWTDQRIEGGQWITADAPLAKIPLYVRAGSIIPMAQPVAHTGEKTVGPVQLHSYPGKEGRFELYSDDGVTYDYEKGAFDKTIFTADKNGTVYISGEKKPLKKDTRYTVVVHQAKKPDPANQVSCTADLNVRTDGCLTIHACVVNTGPNPVEVKGTLTLAQGWVADPGSDHPKNKKVHTIEHLSWEITPRAHALPLISRGSILFEITQNGEIVKIVQELCWGSGFASRFLVAGAFHGDNYERVENNPDQLHYSNDDTVISWNSNPKFSFNCFGYVDCKQNMKRDLDNKGGGTAYAKCRVWSDKEREVFAEAAADYNLKLWINGEVHYEYDSIIVDPTIIDAPVRLKKGWNSVMIRVQRSADGLHTWSGRELGFRFRFVERDGALIESLYYCPS